MLWNDFALSRLISFVGRMIVRMSNVKIYSLVACGGMLQGVAMSIFLFPHAVPSGGAGGLAVLLHYWFHFPLSFALWFVNFSMLVVAIKWLGNASTIGTMFSISITSLTMYILENTMTWQSPTGNVWLDLFFGSLLLGCGVGLLLRQNVSNGGMGVLALIIANHRNIPPGKPLLLLNGSIFILTASIIDWLIIIQAIVSQGLSTRVVDLIYNIRLPATTKPLSPALRKKR